MAGGEVMRGELCDRKHSEHKQCWSEDRYLFPPPDEFTSDQQKLRNLAWSAFEEWARVDAVSTSNFALGLYRQTGVVEGLIMACVVIGAKDKSESWEY